VNVYLELEVFFDDHRDCGALESEVADAEPLRVVVSCSCGAQIARQVPLTAF